MIPLLSRLAAASAVALVCASAVLAQAPAGPHPVDAAEERAAAGATDGVDTRGERVAAGATGEADTRDELADLRAGTARMVALLEQIAASADPAKNPNLNTRRAEHFRQQIAAAQDAGAATVAAYNFARELLHAGQSEAAVNALLQIQQQIDKGGGSAAYPKLAPAIRRELGVAWLRLGEQENCITRHGPDSCLLPIRGGGVHTVPRGSRAAIEVLSASLTADPEDFESRWLLNIAFMTLGEYPDAVPPEWLIPPAVFESEHDIGRFTNIAQQLGLDTVGAAGGGIMEDLDQDGDLDILSSSWGLRDPLRYFVNDGQGGFTERTTEAGLTGIVGGLNLSHADYDNDGDVDVLVIRGAWLDDAGLFPESLLCNLGDGTFADVTEAAGLLGFHPTHSAPWADYDNDGWLDLFMGHETKASTPHPCELFRNDKDGTFTECATEAGVANVGFVKGAAFGDIDNDGRSDLYLSRLGQPNVLYHNDGPGADGTVRFSDVSAAAGVTEPLASFTTWFFDYDNDGWLDILAFGYAWKNAGDQARDYLGLPHGAELPRLYRNDRDGTFTDVTHAANVDHLLLTMGANFGDLDNDGWQDFYCGTGDPDLRAVVPNRMFRNAGGSFFQDVTTAGGFGHLQKGHGVAFGDLDHDGDQDIFEDMGGALEGDGFQNVLYLNPGHGNHWITLLLEGVTSNRSALGARIRVRVAEPGGEREIHATVGTGGSFGGNSLQQELGLGAATAIRSVEVSWPTTGETQRFTDLGLDRHYRIREGEAAAVELERTPIALGQPAATAPGHHDHHGHDDHH